MTATAAATDPPSAATKKASLQPLTAALPSMSKAAFELALRSSALHLQGRDEDIESDRLKVLTADALEGGGSMAPLLHSCCHLLRQAGRKGGMTNAKLENALIPLGFEPEHVTTLIAVLQWVRSGSPAADKPGTPLPPTSPPPNKPRPKKPARLAPAEEAEPVEAAEPPHIPGATWEIPEVEEEVLETIQEAETPVPADEEAPLPEVEDDGILTPRSEATLAAKYLGRLSHVADDAARGKVQAMDPAAKTAKVNTLPSGKWGLMTWHERLAFLLSTPDVAEATKTAGRRRQLTARTMARAAGSVLAGRTELEAYVVTAPFNGTVLKPPAWREDEDLSLDVGDIVVAVGPAPYGKRGWSVGFICDARAFKINRFAIFPSSRQYVRRFRSTDVDTLSEMQIRTLSDFEGEEINPILGYSAVPRVPVDAVEVTGAVPRISHPVGEEGTAEKPKEVSYYSVHCAGPTGESWTVQRRYSEFEQLRADLLHATATTSTGLSREDVLNFTFPAKRPAASNGPRLRVARTRGFDTWLSQIHAATAGVGRTSHAYILLRRFLRPAAPLRQPFSGFEHNGESFPAVNLQVYPDSDAKGTAEFVALKLGIKAVATFTKQLSKFITANGRLRLEVDKLIPAGLGVQYVLVLPSDDSAETAVNRFAMRVKEEHEYAIGDACKKEIVGEIKQRMRRVC